MLLNRSLQTQEQQIILMCYFLVKNIPDHQKILFRKFFILNPLSYLLLTNGYHQCFLIIKKKMLATIFLNIS